MRARIQPCEAALERLHLQLAALQETLVHARDLKLPAGRGLDALGHIHDLVRIEVQAHDCVVRLRMGGFLLDRKAVALIVELRDPVAARIVDTVAEDRGLAILLGRTDGLAKKTRETGTVEDVVAKNEARGIAAEEILADQKSLCKTVRRWLCRVVDTHAVVGAVAQQTPETRKVLRSRDHEDFADAR